MVETINLAKGKVNKVIIHYDGRKKKHLPEIKRAIMRYIVYDEHISERFIKLGLNGFVLKTYITKNN